MNLYLIFFKHINLICFFLFLFFTNANSESVTNIAIVFDGPSEINQLILDSYKKEIKELTKGEFIVNFPESKTIEADWSVKGVNDAVNKMLQDPSVDILITPGVLSSINVISWRLSICCPDNTFSKLSTYFSPILPEKGAFKTVSLR